MTQRIRPSEQNAETQDRGQEDRIPKDAGPEARSGESKAGDALGKPTAEPPRAAARETPREAVKEPPREPLKDRQNDLPRPKATWVLSSAGQQPPHPATREELLARYRRERALPEEPFSEAGKPTPPPGYRDMIMQPAKPAARFVERLQPPEEPEVPPPPLPSRRVGLSLPQTFLVAATMALAAGAGVGMVNARFFSSHDSSGGPAAMAALEPAVAEAGVAAPPLLNSQQLGSQPAQAPQTTTITKKPVPIATLEVADVSGQTNSYIPLALHAAPAGLNGDILLKISGIPDGAYLTSGRKEEDKIWALTLNELKDVKLVVPEANQPQLDLAVAAFEPKTGELAAPVKTMTVALSDVTIQPASAPPPQQVSAVAAPKATLAPAEAAPAPIPPPKTVNVALQEPEAAPETRQLVLDGDEALRNGDIKAARSAYEKAWSKGAADGAFGLGRSYDPVALSSLDIPKVRPDKAKALSWYQRAASAGNEDAAAAIVRLKLKP